MSPGLGQFLFSSPMLSSCLILSLDRAVKHGADEQRPCGFLITAARTIQHPFHCAPPPPKKQRARDGARAALNERDIQSEQDDGQGERHMGGVRRVCIKPGPAQTCPALPVPARLGPARPGPSVHPDSTSCLSYPPTRQPADPPTY